MKEWIIISVLVLLLAWLSQCSPQFYNCEWYKYTKASEIPARCLPYY